MPIGENQYLQKRCTKRLGENAHRTPLWTALWRRHWHRSKFCAVHSYLGERFSKGRSKKKNRVYVDSK